ncbi:hypothetical protein CJU72_18780 [Pseudomonas fragi]|nr:hypothetical protein CJU72_18780 [Pseudomonas fragi]
MKLWERACSRWHHPGLPEAPRRPNREQARSHTGGCPAAHRPANPLNYKAWSPCLQKKSK